MDEDLDLTWDAETGTAALSGDGLSEAAVVICAAYDTNKRQTDVRYLPVAESKSMTLPLDELNSKICKIFVLTADHLPTADAVALDLDALRNS